MTTLDLNVAISYGSFLDRFVLRKATVRKESSTSVPVHKLWSRCNLRLAIQVTRYLVHHKELAAESANGMMWDPSVVSIFFFDVKVQWAKTYGHFRPVLSFDFLACSRVRGRLIKFKDTSSFFGVVVALKYTRIYIRGKFKIADYHTKGCI